MHEEFSELFVSENVRKTAKNILSNLGMATAIVTVLFVTGAFFTELEVVGALETLFSPSFFLLLFSSLIMYYALNDTGVGHGKAEKEYLDAKEAYEESTKKAFSCKTQKLPTFCTNLCAEELAEARKSLLLPYGIPYAVYLAKYRGKSKKELPETLTRDERSAILRANRLSCQRLTPGMLLDNGTGNGSRKRYLLGMSPNRKRVFRDILILLPTFLSAFFSVSIVFSLIESPSFATFIACMLKVCALLWHGVKGYRTGYLYASRDCVAYFQAKTRLLIQYTESYDTLSLDEAQNAEPATSTPTASFAPATPHTQTHPAKDAETPNPSENKKTTTAKTATNASKETEVEKNKAEKTATQPISDTIATQAPFNLDTTTTQPTFNTDSTATQYTSNTNTTAKNEGVSA